MVHDGQDGSLSPCGLLGAAARAIGPAALAASLAAGCGGSEATGQDGEGIRLGLLTSYSGSKAAVFAEVDRSVRIAINEINEAGGVLGMPLVLDPRDVEGGMAGTLGSARLHESADEGTRLFIHADTGLANIQGAGDAAIERGVLLYETGFSLSTRDLSDQPGLVFRDAMPTPLFMASYEPTFRRVLGGGGTLTYLCSDIPEEVAFCEGAAQVVRTWGIATHVVVASPNAYYTPESFDFTAAAQEAIDAAAGDPWAYLAPSQVTTQVSMLLRIADLAAPGNYPTVIAEEAVVGTPDLFLFMPEAFRSDAVGLVRSPVGNSESSVEFRDGFVRRFGHEPTGLGSRAYASVYLIALAMEAAQSLEPGEIASRLVDVSRQGEPVRASQWKQAKALLRDGSDIDFVAPHGPGDLTDSGDLGVVTVAEWRTTTEESQTSWIPSTTAECSLLDDIGRTACSPTFP